MDITKGLFIACTCFVVYNQHYAFLLKMLSKLHIITLIYSTGYNQMDLRIREVFKSGVGRV